MYLDQQVDGQMMTSHMINSLVCCLAVFVFLKNLKTKLYSRLA